jgi:methionine synthase I (cobalamin-dependent)
VRARWPGPLGAYPEIGDGTPHAPHSVTPDELAAQAFGWLASGAGIIGGCCGTTPEHIRALARLPHTLKPAAESG